jgi:hypothetical protein
METAAVMLDGKAPGRQDAQDPVLTDPLKVYVLKSYGERPLIVFYYHLMPQLVRQSID